MEEYKSFIEINFHMQGALKVVFEGDRSAEEIYKRLTANIPGIKLIPGKTLIFLDEIQKNGEVIPIEVKAGNTATKSLNLFMENYNPTVGIKLVAGNVGAIDSKITIPHYLAMFM